MFDLADILKSMAHVSLKSEQKANTNAGKRQTGFELGVNSLF